MLRDVNSSISGAVRAQLSECEPRDRAAWMLALKLAEQYEVEPVDATAKLLLGAFDALLATPKSRLAVKAAEEAKVEPETALAKLRATHGRGPAQARN